MPLVDRICDRAQVSRGPLVEPDTRRAGRRRIDLARGPERRGADAGTALVHGRLRLDTNARRVYHDNQPVDFSAREFAVLELLLMREGRVVSKEHMVNHLYGWGDEVGPNAIEVYVHRIRKKLEPLGCEIRTVRGMGYLMEGAGGSAP